MMMRPIYLIIFVSMVLFPSTMRANLEQEPVQAGGTLPDSTLVYLPLIDQAHVGLSAVDLALKSADLGGSFTLTSQSQDSAETYETAFTEHNADGQIVGADVFVFNALGNAAVDFADTVAFYRSDPALTEQPSSSVGAESVLFKGAGAQYLMIFYRSNVAVIIGTQNLSANETLAIAAKINAKF